MPDELLSIGTIVSWKSSNTHKTGQIFEIIPPGKLPIDFGYRLGDTALPRTETSYIVKGGVNGKATKFYWPKTNLLTPQESLTEKEIEWCRTHPKQVRHMMAQHRLLSKP